jgi:aminopeptidase N
VIDTARVSKLLHQHCGGCARLHEGLGDAHPFALPGATEHYAADRPVRAEHLRIEVDLDFERQSVAGSCSTRVRAVREVETLTFDAVDLEVDWVVVDDKRADFTNSGRHVRVKLGSPLDADETAEVTIRYSARPARGLYFWGPDEGYPDRPLQAWTQGQDEDSRCWFPCLDAPAQKATSEVLASFPQEMTALSNGRLVSNVIKTGRRTMHYALEQPHSPYLITLAVGQFEEVRDKAGDVELRYLFAPGRRDDALRCVSRTPQMVKTFEEFTGVKYPWGVYSQVFVTEFIFGGMENTAATTLTDTVLHDERAHQDWSAENLISHELAHQWFGDLLTCRDWPHGWLNEGFATYFEVLWKEKADGDDEADQQRRVDLDGYLSEVGSRYARPIVARKFDAPIDLFDRHLYEKGALVLHELRRRLGDELFFKAIRRYVEKNRGRAVETVDLARAIEDATGHNFDRFFDQYVFAAGHPALKVELRWEPEARRLRLKVAQKQKTSGEGAQPIFRLPIDVRVVVGVKPFNQRLELIDAEQTFYVACDDEPTQVSVDPRREVLGTLELDKPLDWWIAELQSAPEARARTEAALALGKEASARAVDALAKALVGDRFWATQGACARALAMARTPRARDEGAPGGGGGAG